MLPLISTISLPGRYPAIVTTTSYSPAPSCIKVKSPSFRVRYCPITAPATSLSSTIALLIEAPSFARTLPRIMLFWASPVIGSTSSATRPKRLLLLIALKPPLRDWRDYKPRRLGYKYHDGLGDQTRLQFKVLSVA